MQILRSELVTRQDRRFYLQRLLFCLVILIGPLCLDFALFSKSSISRLLTTCWFHRFTGLYCPTCGLTRSFVSLLDGKFKLATEMNPLGPFVYSVFLFGSLHSLSVIVSKYRWTLFEVSAQKISTICIALLLFFWGYRNWLHTCT